MPDAVIHPTPQELTAFALGKLPEGAAAAIAAHLESCAACRQAVAGVSADSFLNKVRDAKRDATLLPPSLAKPPNAPSSVGQPAMPIVPCANIPPELANHPKYLVRRELNRGGMGVVYQGWHKEMNRQIVIKVINRALLDKPESLDRFRREIQAAAQLSHPNIVTAHDAEQAGELHMLVMEFVPGQNLAEVLEKKGPLSIRHACHYLRQVAWGLQHAYERGMVHRDIKPQNLIRTPNGRIKILDFGLAKIASEHDRSKGLTASGDYMGTPEYSSPEQAEDASKADIRADLYSLGCTLYCLLAGRPPFSEDTRMKTILAHREKAPQPLTQLRPDVPERLWRVVARLLAKDPAKRYQKPIEVVQALAPFVKSGATPPPAVNSPVKRTKVSAATNQIKKVLQEVSGKAPPKQEPAKEEARSPFADLSDTGAASKDVVRLSARVKSYLAVWWKRLKVSAVVVIASLALIGTAVIISKFKEQLANDKMNKRSESNRDTGKSKSSPAKATNPEPKDSPTPPNKSSEESSTPAKPPKQQIPDDPPRKKDNIEDKNLGNANAKAGGFTLPDDASVDDLRKALKHADPDVREIAAARLAKLGPKAKPALDALAETMNDAKNPVNIRRNAALAIAHMGAEAKPVVPALAKALQSSQPQEVRMFAAEGLQRMKYPANEKGIPAILDAIEKDTDAAVRNKCVEALFEMDRPKFKESGAEQLLTKVLNERDKNPMTMVRYSAARKLAHLLRDEAPDKTADVLLEWLTDTSVVGYNGTDVQVEGVSKEATANRTNVRAKFGDDARFMAAEALGWLGDKAAKRPDVVEALRKAAKDKDERLKKAAQQAMKDLNIKE